MIVAGIAVLFYLYGFHPTKWISQYGTDAEAYARQMLSGNNPELPPSLSAHRIETGSGFVSFHIPSGPLESHGMAYSLDGKTPDHGLGGEPRIVRWSHARDHWYFWGAD